MTALFSWLDGAAGAWIPFAIDVALKSALLLLAAFGATLTLRRASASLRHHVWTLAFGAVLALPLLAWTLPAWQVAVPGWTGRSVVTTPPPGRLVVEADGGIVARDSEAGVVAGRTTRIESEGMAVSGSADRVMGSAASRTEPEGLALPFWSPGRLVLVVWLAGTLLFLSRLMVGVLSAWWTSRVATPIDDPEWRRTIETLKRELGIAGDIRVLHSPWVGTPMAWGLLRPALLLPDDALSWSADRRRAVALHELAHVKRRDCLVHVLAQATRAVHWVNPLAWVGAKRIRAERERACDDLVLTSGTRSADYARLLLDVARSRGDRRLTWAAVSMARPSELEGRLLAILDPARDRRGLGRTGSLAACFGVAAMALPLAAFQAAPTPNAEPGPVARAPSSAPAPSSATGSLEAAPAPREAETPRAGFDPRIDPGRPAGATEVEGSGDLADLVARAATRAVERLGPRSAAADTTEERLVAVMARALRNERADFRAKAAHTLGIMESRLGVEPLSAAIRDESAEVRSQAAWALGMIESADGVPALSIAIQDEDAEVRSQAAWALGMIESVEGVAPLLVALGDDSDSVRGQAAWGLGMIESAEALNGLIAALRSDSSAEVRGQAAWALGMIEDRAAADALVDALEDESEEVARKAMWALGMIVR